MSLWEKLKRLWDFFGGEENKTFLRWRRKKRRDIFIRSYLSLTLACLLAFLALVRELVDIFANDYLETTPWLFWPWIVFLFCLIAAVFGAVVWEVLGDKLDVSEREKRFAVGMRDLLSEIEKLKKHVWAAQNTGKVNDELNSFIDKFLNTSCHVLCGGNKVHAGVMFHDTQTNSLNLYNRTDGSAYPDDVTIVLDETKDDTEKGPAEMAFNKTLMAHMPEKSKKIGWVYNELDGEYVFKEFVRGWVEPPASDSEIFESVLSIPITSYAKEGKKAYHGVLNYTTAAKDHFIPRDYVMAVCFASILAQAKDAARFRIEQLSQPAPAAHPKKHK
jgi:hypothetical protein